MGIPDPIVQAMISSHASSIADGRQSEEREGLRKEIAALRAILEKQQGSSGSGGPVVQTKEGPMSAVACTAKRLAAVKLCEQIPWPGSTACQAGAEQSSVQVATALDQRCRAPDAVVSDERMRGPRWTVYSSSERPRPA